jgi:hypothetical protein
MELEPEPELFKSRNRNRNHNFSKVGTGTVKIVSKVPQRWRKELRNWSHIRKFRMNRIGIRMDYSIKR